MTSGPRSLVITALKRDPLKRNNQNNVKRKISCKSTNSGILDCYLMENQEFCSCAAAGRLSGSTYPKKGRLMCCRETLQLKHFTARL